MIVDNRGSAALPEQISPLIRPFPVAARMNSVWRLHGTLAA
jgi:hypothetical protein